MNFNKNKNNNKLVLTTFITELTNFIELLCNLLPQSKELQQTVEFIKKKFKGKLPKILYGGSVNPKNINDLKKISSLDGFLIGGASQSSKKFIDIVKKTFN